MRERRRTNAGGSIDLRVNPPWKGKRKKGGKERQRKTRYARIRWKRSGWSWIPRCDNLPPDRGTARQREQCYLGDGRECPGRIGSCARESFITIPSILRFAAPRLRQRKVVNRFERFARLQIVIFPEEKTRWSRLTAREKGGAWRSVQGANVFGTFAIHIAIRTSRGLGDETQKCLNLFNFTHKEILIESVALKREFYKRQKFAGLENTFWGISCLSKNICLKNCITITYEISTFVKDNFLKDLFMENNNL